MKFGEDWKPSPTAEGPTGRPNEPREALNGDGIKTGSDLDSVSEISLSSEEKAMKVERVCTSYLVPGLAIGLSIIFVLLVPLTAGSSSSAGNPKVIIFVVEGMKGTAFEYLLNEYGRLPNIQNLIAAQSPSGRYARCLSLQDSGCAQAQSGPALGGSFSFQSGPGLASILSGVDSSKHKVYNDSYDAYQQYFLTSKNYPSFLTLAMNAGFQTAVVGGSHLLTSISFGGTCSDYGILDFECSAVTAGMCLSTSSCNANRRSIVLPSNGFTGAEETSITDTLSPLLNDVGADVVIVHLGKLSRLAADPNNPDWFFSENSLPFAAESYLFDAIVGQVAALATTRSSTLRENWLLLGVSDHGGVGKTFGTNAEDQLVTFFSAVITSGTVPITQRPYSIPTSQFDVAPTVLTWLGVPFANNSFDGVVQGICSDGKYPQSCSLSP